ncbi:MAG TPA: hypothetical protein VGY98_01050 [Verrucomicrobiae bacterium]|nr:hypothetical protein [Verrucomicrobiae bacterium]
MSFKKAASHVQFSISTGLDPYQRIQHFARNPNSDGSHAGRVSPWNASQVRREFIDAAGHVIRHEEAAALSKAMPVGARPVACGFQTTLPAPVNTLILNSESCKLFFFNTTTVPTPAAILSFHEICK